MKHYVKAIAGLVLVVALLCVGCAGSGNNASPKNISELPEYTTLSALIGCTMEEVLTKMGWQSEELIEEEVRNYKTPLTVEYAGVSFRVWFAFNNLNGRLQTFIYRAEYVDAEETAAKEITQVFQKLGDALGREPEKVSSGIFERTEEQLRESLEQKKLKQEGARWNLNEAAEASHKDYINDLKALENDWDIWERYEGQYTLEAMISHITEKDTVYLTLELGIMMGHRSS